jgi:hypothetical protein
MSDVQLFLKKNLSMQVAMKQSLTFSCLSMQFQSHLRRQQLGEVAWKLIME